MSLNEKNTKITETASPPWLRALKAKLFSRNMKSRNIFKRISYRQPEGYCEDPLILWNGDYHASQHVVRMTYKKPSKTQGEGL